MTVVKQISMVVLAIDLACALALSPADAADATAGTLRPVTTRLAAAIAPSPLLAGLKVESPVARFARDIEEEPLYVVRQPEWSHEPPDWVEPHRLVSATAFDEPTHELLAAPAAEPSSLWE